MLIMDTKGQISVSKHLKEGWIGVGFAENSGSRAVSVV